jgi:isoleucyl-tRNA synthetase
VYVQAAAAGLLLFVKREMEAYRLYTVVPRLLRFIEDLTNWYSLTPFTRWCRAWCRACSLPLPRRVLTDSPPAE